jgi:ATP-dependent helicase/nuclease subunit A
VSAGRIEELRRADDEARRAAQKVFDRAVVLEAGAGTGKTSALVARLVCWCVGPGWERAAAALGGAATASALGTAGRRGRDDSVSEAVVQAARAVEPHPDRIAARVLEGVVAITFTDAAAAEMAARVARALAALARGEAAEGIDAAALPEAPALRRERAAHLLLAVDRLRVSTIHAFCSRLLAANPAEAGVHPSFAVDAGETRVEEIVRAAVAARLRREAYGPAADDVVTLAAGGIGPDRIAAVLAALVRDGVPEEALADDPCAPERVAALGAALAARAAGLSSLIGDRFAGRRRARNAVALVEALRALPARLPTSLGHGAAHGAPEARLPAVTAGGEQASAATAERVPGLTLVDLKALVATHLPDTLRKHLAKWATGDLGAEERAAAGDIAAELAAAARDLATICSHVERADEPLLRAACRVLAPLLAEVRRAMRDAGVLTYSDLLGRCRDLLRDHPETAARERRAIEQLVVDEFQDTDALQCEIVAALALEGDDGERPGLFLVGDPKQSIYGWRNADLAAYEAFVGRVLAAGGVRHALSVNFRSVPAVLDEVERCLGDVMARDPGFQPAFEPLLPCPARETDAGFARAGRAPVEHWIIAAGGEPAAGGSEGATEVEASAAAADIAELHAREGVAWSEVAILMRATGDLPTYLQALRDAGVPYAVERERTFYRRREILEASALVRAVLDPADHVALVAWLRSACVGVPDAALLPLWSRGFPGLMTELVGPDAGALARLRAAIAGAAAATPAVPGSERIAGWEQALMWAVETLAHARAAFAARPAAELVEVLRAATLVEATEAARALGVYRVANLDRFFRLLLAAMDETGAHPQAVLERLRRALREPEQEEARLRDAAVDAVRVLTIHKAKGLDFGHVYLVQAGRGMPNENLKEAAAARVGDAWELSLFRRPSPGWWRAAARSRRTAEAELVRTLYVAMTRARVRLVVSGDWPALAAAGPGARPSHLGLLARRRGGIPDITALVAAAAADGGSGGSRAPQGAPEADAAQGCPRPQAPGTACRDHGGVAWRVLSAGAADRRHAAAAAAGAPADPAAVAAQARTLARLGAEAASRMARPWSAPASAEAHRLFAADARDGEEDAAPRRAARPTGGGGSEIATAAGTLVHRVLEELDLADDIAAQLAAARPAIARRAAALVPAVDPGAVAERAAAILARMAASPLLARLAAVAPCVVARELPVLLPPHDVGSSAAPRSPGAGGAPDRAGGLPGETGSIRSDGNAGAPVAFVAGAIDLVYRDPDSAELVVADYKTDEAESEAALAEKAATYRSQGAVYCRALQDALRLPAPPRFELWFLSAGCIVPVSV